MRTVHGMQRYAGLERSASVCAYEEDRASNGDKKRIQEGTRELEGLFGHAETPLTVYTIQTVTNVTSCDILSRYM